MSASVHSRHHTKSSAPDLPFHLLSEMEQAEEIGDSWYDADTENVPPPSDDIPVNGRWEDGVAEHHAAPSKKAALVTKAETASSDDEPDAEVRLPPTPPTRSHSSSIDDQRMPTWIPFHLPGCQHAWHHHLHLPPHQEHSHPIHKTKPAATKVLPCGCQAHHFGSKNAEDGEVQTKDEPEQMTWWPEPDTVAQRQWVEKNENPRSGFGVEEALNDDEVEALVNF
jgi:hypothetical protein